MKDTQLLTEALISRVIEISKMAGKAILDIYDTDIEVFSKEDKSPLTKADLAAHNIICKELSRISSLPILSEENKLLPWPERSKWHSYWLIDPLDGTKEFIKRNGEFTVNIALIEEHEPVFGVVYAPVLDACYWGAKEQGAYVEIKAKKSKLKPTEPASLENLRVVGSRSHTSPDMESFLKNFTDYEIVPKGSSLKLCMVAEGSADIYPRLGLTSEWDTAAGHAVVNAAGGYVCLLDGSPLKYNAEADILNPYFLVLSRKLFMTLFTQS